MPAGDDHHGRPGAHRRAARADGRRLRARREVHDLQHGAAGAARRRASHWLPGDPSDRFWYRTTTEKGAEAVLIDPVTGTRSACDLPACQATDRDDAARRPAASRYDELSPDGRRQAFVRDWNLWVRDVASGRETQLTRDGVKDFGYATDNAGWTRSDRPILKWSPDSKKIATFQQDQRGVGEMYLVDTKVGHPTLQAWKYPLPGDETRHDDSPRRHRRRRAARSCACRCRPISTARRSATTWRAAASGATCSGPPTVRPWRSSRPPAITAASSCAWPMPRPATIREVLEEKAETFFESGNGAVNWRYLPASNEVIWFSERDNWGHLYLHDLRTGREKHPITTGEGNVTQLLRVDEKNRLLYFVGGRTRARARPVLPPPLSHRHGRQEPAAADARGRRPRRLVVAVGPLLRRQLFEARRAGRGAASRRRRAS